MAQPETLDPRRTTVIAVGDKSAKVNTERLAAFLRSEARRTKREVNQKLDAKSISLTDYSRECDNAHSLSQLV